VDNEPQEEEFIPITQKKPIPGSRVVVKIGGKDYSAHYRSTIHWFIESEMAVHPNGITHWKYE